MMSAAFKRISLFQKKEKKKNEHKKIYNRLNENDCVSQRKGECKENIGNKCENKPVTNQQTSIGNQMQSANVVSKLNPIKFLIEMLQFLGGCSMLLLLVFEYCHIVNTAQRSGDDH